MGPREPGYWASRWFSRWLLASSAQSHKSKMTNPYPVGRQVAIGTISPIRCSWCKIQANTEQKTHYSKLKGSKSPVAREVPLVPAPGRVRAGLGHSESTLESQ